MAASFRSVLCERVWCSQMEILFWLNVRGGTIPIMTFQTTSCIMCLQFLHSYSAQSVPNSGYEWAVSVSTLRNALARVAYNSLLEIHHTSRLRHSTFQVKKVLAHEVEGKQRLIGLLESCWHPINHSRLLAQSVAQGRECCWVHRVTLSHSIMNSGQQLAQCSMENEPNGGVTREAL